MSIIKNFQAGGTIPKYSAVYISSGEVVVTTAATVIPLGIAQADAVDGDQVPVLLHGETLGIATDNAVAVGELLSAVASGELDTKAATAGHYYFATALEASGAANDYVEIFVQGAVLQDDGT